ncbi:RNA exonuclease 5-like isoform X2 [Megalops cyprinoides]|uniref:RNA exonuclease 5-like isoform X2 n=1 Tax=Megalops cyprinoides TaxID=118141 RepID=UPI001865121F|nr:RNA exonuclease 5-like isoform X2 [Megalops cyprinoides]
MLGKQGGTFGCKRKSGDALVSDHRAGKSRKLHDNTGEPELSPQPQESKGTPCLSLSFDEVHKTITQKQLIELLLFAALGVKHNVKQPSWCYLHHQKNICGVNVTVLEGLTQLHFYRYYLQFKNLRKRYRIRQSFLPSSGNVLSDIFNTKLPVSESNSPLPERTISVTTNNLDHQKDLTWHPVIRKYGTETQGLTHYLLSTEEMGKKAFPLKGHPGYETFLCTESDDCVSDSSPLYGLDCEMCLTERGNELTRVSLVDSGGRCLLDELVKPENRILNYLTRYSGITKALLKPVTTRLKDVQAKLKETLPRDAVLVGHSLNHDLQALNLIHPHVIDTSLLFRRESGQRFKLKFLAEAVLNKKIQCEGKNGHNPTEDAVAALELAQYFISRGPKKVVELNLDGVWRGHATVKETPVNGAVHIPHIRFTEALQAAGRSAVHLGRAARIDTSRTAGQWRTVKCISDGEVLSSFKREIPSCFFSVVQFPSLAEKTEAFSTGKKSDELFQKMLARQREMCTVYVGPLPKDWTAMSVRKLFRRCGPIQSVRLLNFTKRAHAIVEFELLEGACLAVGSLNGYELDGHSIKVLRPVKESTLDLEVILQELENDVLNENVIYISGMPEQDLQQAFCQFGTIEGMALPKKPSLRKHRKHAFIKYQNVESMEAALNSSVEHKGRKVKVCKALTPSHLQSWTGQTQLQQYHSEEWNSGEGESSVPEESDYSDQQLCHESEMKDLMRKLDRKVGKLFKALPKNTLSVILLPGQTRADGDFSGLCLIGVKGSSSAESKKNSGSELERDSERIVTHC